ncbi:hypothetical protein KEM54_002393 [Ascosphaera aggregata]|nr:hypothetical protein KEM54_002393 [Ascosphaera aggregata]
MAPETDRARRSNSGAALPQIHVDPERPPATSFSGEGSVNYVDDDDDDDDADNNVFQTPDEEKISPQIYSAYPTPRYGGGGGGGDDATATATATANDGVTKIILSGRQEHYLKRELISLQVKDEISCLNSPTALRTFGPPFRCDDPRIAIQKHQRYRSNSNNANYMRARSNSSIGSDSGSMTAIENSQLPILRYVFSHHIRNFPFLDKAREKEFWQYKLQVFLESFASKHISPSADRHEQTKRRKIAIKCEKLLELMMVSALRTSSGYEERIQFSEMEVIDRGADEGGLLVNKPEGGWINGWDVNIAGVRVLEEKRRIVGKERHAQFIFTVRHGDDGGAIYVGRRFGDFAKLLKRLHTQFPGKVLPTLPHKNKISAEVSAATVDSPTTDRGHQGMDTASIYADSLLDDGNSINSSETGYTYGGDDSTSGSASRQGSTSNLISNETHRLSSASATQLPYSTHSHWPSQSPTPGTNLLQVPNPPNSAAFRGGETASIDEGAEDDAAAADKSSRRRSFHRPASIGRRTKEKLRSVKSHTELALKVRGDLGNRNQENDQDATTGRSAEKSRILGRRRHKSRHGHARSMSGASNQSAQSTLSLRSVGQHHSSQGDGHVTLYREQQRISLRAFLRTLLQNPKIASSKAMLEFLTANPIPSSSLTADDKLDMARRKEMDHRRLLEQQRFFEVARKRARELDVYMEKFRQSVVEDNGLSRLFGEIKEKNSIQEMSPEYVKFVEWARIEVAATLYHMFLADDNAPELFAQMKRIHSLIPYTLMKNVIRLTNPAAVMAGVLDIFLAQPFGSKSLIQRILGMAMGDGIRSLQRSIDVLTKKISQSDQMVVGPTSPKVGRNVTGGINMDVQPVIRRLRAFVESEEDVKQSLRDQAKKEGSDIVVVICMADPELLLPGYRLAAVQAPGIVPAAHESSSRWFSRGYSVGGKPAVEDLELENRLVERVFNGFVAWVSTVEDENTEENDESAVADLQADAIWFAWLKQLIKVLIRHRDKRQMLEVIEEPVTVSLFRDLFTIFYEPLVRVYKSANVYSSITDFAAFVDDAIHVVERAQSQDFSADPNVTVQSFIDLCARHQDDFYKFVHEVHLHDNGLFDSLMGWIEDILSFLRHGPKSGSTLDINGLFTKACQNGDIDREKCVEEIDSLIQWHEARKRWHHDKTRQKMATETEPNSAAMQASLGGVGAGGAALPGLGTFSGADFGLHEADLEELAISDEVLEGDSQGTNSSEYSESDDGAGTLAGAKSGLIAAERRRRAKRREREKLRRTAGEPVKPKIEEVHKLRGEFTRLIREALAS